MSVIFFRDSGCGRPSLSATTKLPLGWCLNVPPNVFSITVDAFAACPNSGTPVLIVSAKSNCPNPDYLLTESSTSSSKLATSTTRAPSIPRPTVTESCRPGDNAKTAGGGDSQEDSSSCPQALSERANMGSPSGRSGESSGGSSWGPAGGGGGGGGGRESGGGTSSGSSDGSSDSSSDSSERDWVMITANGGCYSLPSGDNIGSIEFACPALTGPGPTATAVLYSGGARRPFRKSMLVISCVVSCILAFTAAGMVVA
ncbi:uncharacterized protein JN550_012610 [Neoarthrinium moseri]|uniref:uncharacterized protein n=1 Tax=Neoarthrinium moseri TaxID=1658444 RepID=UPI001FDDFBE4|nr:uncharacterized protein JN550_012610 [Neoarthrinium moseri]KAI1858477.1 hypothetical protein JN550_012610 [Neoarthrinium moseri]